MSSDFTQARVGKNFLWDGLNLYLRQVTDNGGVRRIAYPENQLVFKLVDEFYTGFEPSPVASLGAASAQVLMDDLWNCGIRPSEGSGSRHLEDLRALVARSYAVELKQI
jgi:hypothetical protein